MHSIFIVFCLTSISLFSWSSYFVGIVSQFHKVCSVICPFYMPVNLEFHLSYVNASSLTPMLVSNFFQSKFSTVLTIFIIFATY